MDTPVCGLMLSDEDAYPFLVRPVKTLKSRMAGSETLYMIRGKDGRTMPNHDAT